MSKELEKQIADELRRLADVVEAGDAHFSVETRDSPSWTGLRVEHIITVNDYKVIAWALPRGINGA